MMMLQHQTEAAISPTMVSLTTTCACQNRLQSERSVEMASVSLDGFAVSVAVGRDATGGPARSARGAHAGAVAMACRLGVCPVEGACLDGRRAEGRGCLHSSRRH